MDDLAKIMQQALAENEAAAQNLVAGARVEREAAAAERAAARVALIDTEHNAGKLYADFVEKHRSRIARSLQLEIAGLFAQRLLLAGESIAEAAALLDLPDGMVQELARKHGL